MIVLVSLAQTRESTATWKRKARIGGRGVEAEGRWLTAEMAQRVTLRKRTPYNTTSNRRRVVKTPGGKLVVHHIKKLTVSYWSRT